MGRRLGNQRLLDTRGIGGVYKDEMALLWAIVVLAYSMLGKSKVACVSLSIEVRLLSR